jgi:hypothetical protein
VFDEPFGAVAHFAIVLLACRRAVRGRMRDTDLQDGQTPFNELLRPRLRFDQMICRLKSMVFGTYLSLIFVS